MSRMPALAVSIVVLAALAHAQSPPPPIGEGIDGFQTWLDMVRRHTPGKVDSAITQVRRIGIERHFTLRDDLEALIVFIEDPSLDHLERTRRKYSTAEQIVLKRIATAERRAGTTDNLLRKIALLESDDMMLTGGERYVVVQPLSRIPKDMVFSMDGLSLQSVTTPPNWQIGRLAISAISDDPEMRAWAQLWYEATTAFLFFDRVPAVLRNHLPDRRLAFPDDAGAWFDEGCRFEEFAGARFQHAMVDGRRKRLPIAEHDRDESLDEARRMFEAALERNPRHPEARLRLGRVRLLQGDARSAVKELSAALPDLGADSVARYLAYLFLGAAQETAGNQAAAMTAYREAATLYPKALSPRVSLARLEPPTGPGADPLEAFLHEERRRSDDPWLTYHTGPAGRSRTLSAELWRVSTLR